MSSATRRALAAGSAGALFGAGLLLSRMTDPRNVLAFLDVFGAWNGSLMWVMAGAIGVHAIGYRLIRKRARPWLDTAFRVPTRRELDAKLVLGAALFGVGWGLSGFCPGPGVVGIASLRVSTLVFVAAVGVGTLLAHWLDRRRGEADAPPSSGAWTREAAE